MILKRLLEKMRLMRHLIEQLVREFSLEATEKAKAKIYNGWQEVPREFARLKCEILLLSVNPKFEELKIDENEEVMDWIMKVI